MAVHYPRQEMIFIHGDVHCDPHAANMLVRPLPGGDWRLVLLDHGLYRRIDDDFRWGQVLGVLGAPMFVMPSLWWQARHGVAGKPQCSLFGLPET